MKENPFLYCEIKGFNQDRALFSNASLLTFNKWLYHFFQVLNLEESILVPEKDTDQILSP